MKEVVCIKVLMVVRVGQKLLNPGMPKGLVGKIGVSVSPVNSNRVFAIVENATGGGLFRSEDGGDNCRVSANRNYAKEPGITLR